MSVLSKMTAIADAIRAKTGGTDTLTLDEMAAAIASLQAGEGGALLPDWMTEMTSGTVTFAANTDSVSIDHGLGGKPKGFVFFRKGADNSSEMYLNYCYGYSYKFFNNNTGGSFSGTLVLANGASARVSGSYTATNTSFLVYNDLYNYECKATTAYHWFAWR